jgi:hypothetical protein
MARRPQPKPHLNPCWTSEATPQPNINKGGGETELRQMLGSGKIAETFKRGAKHFPICPSCGIEVAPGDRGVVHVLGSTPYEQILIMSGVAEEIVYHKDCEAPETINLLEELLKKG